MTRILLLIILGWILIQILKRMAVNADSKSSSKPEEKFVLCVNCGCHVPEHESKIKDNKIVCNNPECDNK